MDVAKIKASGDAALAQISNALDDLEYSPDQRPVPLLWLAMDYVRDIIAELGQEVGAEQAPAWFYVRTPGADYDYTFTKTREEAIDLQDCDEPDEPIPLYTSPAHTSEARDAASTRSKAALLFFAKLRETSDVYEADASVGIFEAAWHCGTNGLVDALNAALDAAMRQEGGK